MTSMDVNEATTLLAKINAVWSSVRVDRVGAEVWSSALFDVPLSLAEKALGVYLRGANGPETFPPRPADLLRSITTAVLNMPSEDDAWRIVAAEIARVGMPHRMFHAGAFYEVGPAFECVEIALAVDAVGYRTLVTEEGTYAQKAFKDAYKRYVEQTQQKALTGSDVAAYRIDRARTLRTVKVGAPPKDYAVETIVGTLGIQKDGRRAFVALANRSES